MKAMSPLQKLIQSIEVGKWAGRLRLALGALAVLLLLVGYDLRQFRNLSTREAMDSAQLARNISEGKGFTTQFIRPLSLFLVKRANQGRVESLSPERWSCVPSVLQRHGCRQRCSSTVRQKAMPAPRSIRSFPKPRTPVKPGSDSHLPLSPERHQRRQC